MFSLRKLPLELRVAVAALVVFFSMVVSRTYLSESLTLSTRTVLFRVQFILFVNALMLIGSLYTWKKIVGAACKPCAAPSCCLTAWKVAVFAFLACAHLSFFTLLLLVSEEPYIFSLVSYTCLGVYVMLLFWLFVLGCIERVYKLLARTRARTDGRSGNKQAARALLAIAVTLALTVVGLINASRPPFVKHLEIPVQKLPPSVHNLKMILLSDIHLGPTVGKTKLEMVVKMVNELKPDITVIVGDLTDSQVINLQTAVEPLGQLNSRLGTYFVTGNHEYYTADVNNWFKHLESLNIHPLHNENAKISGLGNSDDWFCLAGVDDIEAGILRYPGHGMDLDKALDGCGPEHATVLLAHQPRAAKWALQARPDISLVLSGHTHGGQIFPLTITAYLLNPFFSGLYKVGKSSFVYVTPGTMYYGVPMRLASRAEITEIILLAH
ncbi:transmembrane protein with metallophosphoesterase domain [Latimeria chalumnae]|uniref:Transmembrane protein with metallophosphoesterase domain n=1 Tax=Latimeria chalumnae TaxID=7897 RepID=H3AX39_LATCH|nr:PREDICTED: transmembrane protein with metallophosphoesterase domain [Latimeria chalumnae]|eukprot:XP_005997248.1 PREDICTED: transmembrane protein with metallophosphoesterase domain [Latimeria chalumnae]